MKIKYWLNYLSLVIVHLVILLVSFPAFFRNPANSLFCNWGDGIKNYFTLLSYVKEPISKDGIFKYNSFFYPFGDYVFYTDNTPLLSIPFKWFCHCVHDFSDYTIPLFNVFILSQIILTAFLVFYIFKKLLGSQFFAFILAIYLPITNMQILRIWAGHFNLSIATVVLLAIVLFIQWHKNIDNAKRRLFVFVGMVLLVFCSFLLHGYYIAIILIFLSSMLLVSGILFFKVSYGKQSIVASVLLPIIAFGAAMVLLVVTDKYLNIRPEKPMLYNLGIFKTNFLLLFTHYDFHSLAFPIASTQVLNTENMVYLGNLGLFAFGGIWVGAVCSASFRKKVFGIQKMFFAEPFNKAIFLGGIVMLLISFGDWYTTNNNLLKIYTPFHILNTLKTNDLLIYIGITGLVSYLIVLIFSKYARNRLKIIGEQYRKKPWEKVKLLLGVAIMIYLFIARYSVTMPNLLNPLFYLHFVTIRVEQFRCLARFAWPFYWVFYIWVMFTFYQLYKQTNINIKRLLLIIMLFVCTIEVKDYILQLRKWDNFDNVFAKQHLQKFGKLKIDFKQYQSILPIPFYMVGNEDYPHTIDDNNDWTIYTMQLSLYSSLPLMAGKMSRTPPQYSIALLDFVAKDSMQTSIMSRLNDKPILIILNKSLINDANQINECAKDRPVTRDYYIKACEYVSRHNLNPIDSLGDVYYYSVASKKQT